MIPARVLFLPLLAVLAACTGDRVTGTNDEVSTSLQILADNVRSVPAASTGDDGGAARRALADDTGWNVVEMADHVFWSAWRIVGRTPRTTTDSGFTTYAKTTHANDSLAYLESVETYVLDDAGTRRTTASATIRNRGGFVWRSSRSIVLNTPGEWGDGFTTTWRLDFPSLGLHCEYEVEETDLGSDHLLALLHGGVPLLSGDRVVGSFSIDTASGAMRWMDLEGRAYAPRPLPFANNAQDSIGLRVHSATRGSLEGLSGLRIRGRFSLPVERYGFRTDSLRLQYSFDSTDMPDSAPSIPMSFAQGPFALFVPSEAFGDAPPVRIRLVVPVRSRADSTIENGRISSPAVIVR